jgi:hypothetical protein
MLRSKQRAGIVIADRAALAAPITFDRTGDHTGHEASNESRPLRAHDVVQRGSRT